MSYPPDTSLILVAVMPHLRDLEYARLLGWYRIPLRSAPKVISVDYLAFYQTNAFGDAGARIQYVAPVRGHELITRAALLRDQPDHPHAREEYYRIQLGPLATLPEPILSREWRRITFFYTTGEYLRLAESVEDLVVRSEDRKLLWRSLRERAIQSHLYQTEDLPEMPLDPEILALLGLFLGEGPKGKIAEEPAEW